MNLKKMTDRTTVNNINVNEKSYAKVASDAAADIGERGKKSKSRQIIVKLLLLAATLTLSLIPLQTRGVIHIKMKGKTKKK